MSAHQQMVESVAQPRLLLLPFSIGRVCRVQAETMPSAYDVIFLKLETTQMIPYTRSFKKVGLIR